MTGTGAPEVGLELGEDVDQRRRHVDPGAHREAQPVGLARAVVRVLAEDHHLDRGVRGEVEGGEHLVVRRVHRVAARARPARTPAAPASTARRTGRAAAGSSRSSSPANLPRHYRPSGPSSVPPMTSSMGRSQSSPARARGWGRPSPGASPPMAPPSWSTTWTPRRPEAIADEIGGEVRAFDVADSAAFDAAVDGVVERHGRLDILVNNAGILDRPTRVLERMARRSAPRWRVGSRSRCGSLSP